jgi:hypothetical protein
MVSQGSLISGCKRISAGTASNDILPSAFLNGCVMSMGSVAASAPNMGSPGSATRMQVSRKSPHQGFFDGSPRVRPSRFSQSISQDRPRASWRPRAVLASVIQGKGPGGATDAARPLVASSALMARAVRRPQRPPSMAPGEWPSLSRPLWIKRMDSRLFSVTSSLH